MHLLKRLATDFMTGTFTEALDPEKVGYYKNKTPLQVLTEMEAVDNEDFETYKNRIAQLVFPSNTMRSFTIDHLNRTYEIYNQVMTTEEIKLDKFTSYDLIKGVTFDRGAFEQALKEKFFKPMRYAYSTYAMLDYAQNVRAIGQVKDPETGETKTGYKTMRLAESMFGREILHQHEFFLDEHNPPDIRSEDWAEHIDWAKVNSPDGKVAIWRRVALARLSMELYAHRDFYSTDPKYGWWYYKDVIEVLEKIPDTILGDEMDMQSSKAVGHFFTHHDMEWLRKKSSTTEWQLYREAIIKDVFKGSAKGFWQALQMFMKGIAKV
jgi:hypothetical protein